MIRNISLMAMAATAAIAALVLPGCRTARGTADAPVADAVTAATEPVPVAPGPEIGAMPRAVIYRTNGYYPNQVPVTLNGTRTAIMSYPAPSDLGPYSTPLSLTGGYLLDRRGVNANTGFLRYTYDEYRALPEAPSPAELMEALIPDARVVEIRRLPMTIQQAESNTALIDSLISSNSPEIRTIYTAPRVKL